MIKNPPVKFPADPHQIPGRLRLSCVFEVERPCTGNIQAICWESTGSLPGLYRLFAYFCLYIKPKPAVYRKYEVQPAFYFCMRYLLFEERLKIYVTDFTLSYFGHLIPTIKASLRERYIICLSYRMSMLKSLDMIQMTQNMDDQEFYRLLQYSKQSSGPSLDEFTPMPGNANPARLKMLLKKANGNKTGNRSADK